MLHFSCHSLDTNMGTVYKNQNWSLADIFASMGMKPLFNTFLCMKRVAT
jgi:hypothetical protein